MKTLMDKRGVRITAFLLLLIMIFIGSLGAVIWRYGLSDGWKHLSYGFADTEQSKRFVSDGTLYVQENIGYVDASQLSNLGSYAGRAFSYQIILEGGYTVADTTTDASQYVHSRSGEYNGVEYIINGYINLPVEEYDGCYAEYLFFQFGYGLFEWRMELTLGGFLAAAVLLVFLLIALYRQGRRGELSKILHTPLEVVFVVLVAVVFLFYELDSRLWRLGFFYRAIDIVFEQLYWCCSLFVLASALLCLLAAQISSRTLFDRLISVRLCRRIPLGMWIFAVVAFNAVCLFFAWRSHEGSWIILLAVVDAIALIFVERFRFQGRKIQRAVQELSDGNLTYKVNTAHMGSFWKNIGIQLNHIGDGMVNAVEERMKSERMKTELITNVSHDLKTPLTSIISYVQLLNDDSLAPAVKKEYLEILDRQSAKLKKLTEDVVEASKAASGVLAVNTEKLNAGELLEQSVGEFEARMRAAGLEPVVQLLDAPVYLAADSTFLGRVLENLLTNIVKYAQQGTRVYFDLLLKGDFVILSAKNISREQLNISADELMERFVRGDSSRHSEGSGLGLSIARSLTELMGGRLNIVLDGDLFKAEIVFPQMTE